jgi:hypothetical protein
MHKYIIFKTKAYVLKSLVSFLHQEVKFYFTVAPRKFIFSHNASTHTYEV